MSEIKLEDDHLDATHGPTKMLLAAEYWKRRAKQLEMKMNDPIPNPMQITQADINANIDSEYYFTAADGVDGASMASELSIACSYEDSLKLITFCVLVMKNGFSVTGTSVCSSHSYYSAEVGREVAREKAIQNVWPLMAYAVKEKLAEK